jgi:hypothetical protein
VFILIPHNQGLVYVLNFEDLREAAPNRPAPGVRLIPKTLCTFLPLFLCSSGAVRYLMNVPGKAGQDMLLVSSEACMLLDGQELTPRWTLSTAQILRYRVFFQSQIDPIADTGLSGIPQPTPRRMSWRGPCASPRGFPPVLVLSAPVEGP